MNVNSFPAAPGPDPGGPLQDAIIRPVHRNTSAAWTYGNIIMPGILGKIAIQIPVRLCHIIKRQIPGNTHVLSLLPIKYQYGKTQFLHSTYISFRQLPFPAFDNSVRHLKVRIGPKLYVSQFHRRVKVFFYWQNRYSMFLLPIDIIFLDCRQKRPHRMRQD